MATPLVDERRPAARDAVELRPVRLAALCQLVGPVAHSLLPVPGLQLGAVGLQPVEDVVDASGAGQVGREAGQAVVDDVGVRVVEAGQHGRSPEIHDPGFGAAQAHDLATPAGEDDPAPDREVAVWLEARPAEGADLATGQDQIGLHSGR